MHTGASLARLDLVSHIDQVLLFCCGIKASLLYCTLHGMLVHAVTPTPAFQAPDSAACHQHASALARYWVSVAR